MARARQTAGTVQRGNEERCRKSIENPMVTSLADDIEGEKAADYLYENVIPAYAFSTELPVKVLGAKYKWARGASLLQTRMKTSRQLSRATGTSN